MYSRHSSILVFVFQDAAASRVPRYMPPVHTGSPTVTRALIGQSQVQSRPLGQPQPPSHSVCGGRSFPNTADAFSAGWVEEWKGCVRDNDRDRSCVIPGPSDQTCPPQAPRL